MTGLESFALKAAESATIEVGRALEAKAVSEGAIPRADEWKASQTEFRDNIAKHLTASTLDQMSDVREARTIENYVEANAEWNKRMPVAGGEWLGAPGNSVWQLDPNEIPRNPQTNPEGKSWEQINKEHEIEGIPFKEGEPDFSEISRGTVEIEDFSENRFNNFSQADKNLSETWNREAKDGRTWSQETIEQYRKENRLTWHERGDMKTMDLVSTEVHGNIPHEGGIAQIKKQALEVGYV